MASASVHFLGGFWVAMAYQSATLPESWANRKLTLHWSVTCWTWAYPLYLSMKKVIEPILSNTGRFNLDSLGQGSIVSPCNSNTLVNRHFTCSISSATVGSGVARAGFSGVCTYICWWSHWGGFWQVRPIHQWGQWIQHLLVSLCVPVINTTNTNPYHPTLLLVGQPVVNYPLDTYQLVCDSPESAVMGGVPCISTMWWCQHGLMASNTPTSCAGSENHLLTTFWRPLTYQSSPHCSTQMIWSISLAWGCSPADSGMPWGLPCFVSDSAMCHDLTINNNVYSYYNNKINLNLHSCH